MTSSPESHLPLTHLSLEILVVLAKAPSHGYAAIQALHRSPTCVAKPRTGTFYSAIRRLQESGLVEEVEPVVDEGNQDERRRYYGLTALGREVLEAETRRLEALVQIAQGQLASAPKGSRRGAWEVSS